MSSSIDISNNSSAIPGHQTIPCHQRIVRINISNLPPSVVSSDLHELFAEFKLHSAGINFNQNGVPLGSGHVSLSKIHAVRLVRKFANVALDGQPLKFALVELPNQNCFPVNNISGENPEELDIS